MNAEQLFSDYLKRSDEYTLSLARHMWRAGIDAGRVTALLGASTDAGMVRLARCTTPAEKEAFLAAEYALQGLAEVVAGCLARILDLPPAELMRASLKMLDTSAQNLASVKAAERGDRFFDAATGQEQEPVPGVARGA